MNYETVIGLECHVQLKTETKLFSPAKNHFGDAPNENVSIIDAGLPGVLPTLNEKAVTLAIRLGLALGCSVEKTSVFARKHYFYPDLPKGYQTTQMEKPICLGGHVTIDTPSGKKDIALTRIHIEEDAGKSTHQNDDTSVLDYNRAGTPLLEVVTEPVIQNSQEAMAFYRELRDIVRALDVCDGNLQEGSMRADANVSVRVVGERLGQRTETKNLNSIRFVGQAIDAESARQERELRAGKTIVQQTRLWDSEKKQSRVMREKEDAHDYRYFPCPDLLPLVLSDEELEKAREALPELPRQKRERYQSAFKLNEDAAQTLTSDPHLSLYFENVVTRVGDKHAKAVANLVQSDVMRLVRERNKVEAPGSEPTYDSIPISEETLAALVQLMAEKVISQKIARQVFAELENDISEGKALRTPLAIVEAKGWKVVKDEGALEKIVDELIAANQKAADDYRAGKEKMLAFFVGQVMKATKGSADPALVNCLLKERLV